jgi:error-prone DNA polymerase
MRRRDAAWAIKALRDHPMPLFAAADRGEERPRPELREPAVSLQAMTAGREVVEDYRSKGLSLDAHPLAFLRGDLAAKGFAPCADLKRTRAAARISVAGPVLVRQMPGSANGVMFITLEDETGIGNLIVSPSVFEKFRRAILASSMLGCRGKVQRQGEVIHVIAEHLVDFSGELRRVSELDQPSRWPAGRGDGARQTGGPDPREQQGLRRKPRDIYVPDLRIETLKVRARDFR